MSAPRCLVAMYHYVRDVERTAFPGMNALAPRDFRLQLDLLGQVRAPLEYGELEAAVRQRRPVARPCSLLTFDDGFVDHYETVFPELCRRRWTGVFFLVGLALGERPRVLNVHKTHFLIARLGAEAFAAAVRAGLSRQPVAAGHTLAWRDDVYRYDPSGEQEAKHLLNYELPYEVADRVLNDLFAEHLGDDTGFARALYLSPERIREMAGAGMTFGFHTERHRVLSRLDAAGQRAELAQGAERVRELTGQRTVPFCSPSGPPHTYDATTLDVLRDAGYTLAFNTVRRLADPASDAGLELPRYDTRDLPPLGAELPDA